MNKTQEFKPKLVIVISQFNQYIVERLLNGCLATLQKQGLDKKELTVIEVPGAFEIPVVVNKLIMSKKPDAIITLGAIIKGETPHFDFISNCVSAEIARISTDTLVPVIFGVLTVDTVQQAQDRSGEEESNKGSESALAAIKMANVMRSIDSA
jgi:6,7-dimethyl-8-ribityllumazine synthase